MLWTITAIILTSPKLQGLRFRKFRVVTFVFTGLSGFAPLIHGIQVFGLTQMKRQSGLPYYLVEGLLLVLSVLFYATSVPERIYPDRFDIWRCSHEIFPVLIVAATRVHAYGIFRAFDNIYQGRQCIVYVIRVWMPVLARQATYISWYDPRVLGCQHPNLAKRDVAGHLQ